MRASALPVPSFVGRDGEAHEGGRPGVEGGAETVRGTLNVTAVVPPMTFRVARSADVIALGRSGPGDTVLIGRQQVVAFAGCSVLSGQRVRAARRGSRGTT